MSWDCVAYGPQGRDVGALCFFAADHERICGTEEACRAAMAGERLRVFRRIQELAASGDFVGRYLAREFTSPDQLLNAEGAGLP